MERHCGPHSSTVSNVTKNGSSRTFIAEPSLRCTSLRRPIAKSDHLDVDQSIQHKVQEGKMAHKRAEKDAGLAFYFESRVGALSSSRIPGWMSAKKQEPGIYEKWNIKRPC